MLGHDTGNTFTNPHASGPSDDPEIRWTFERNTGGLLTDYQTFHPLIVDGTVYISAPDTQSGDVSNADQWTWEFLAIDAETGDSTPIFQTDDRISHPTIIDGILYASVGSTIRAYDLETGNERWRQNFGFGVSAIRKVHDVVIITRSCLGVALLDKIPHVMAIDASSGEVLWQQKRKDVFCGPRLPIVYGDAVYIQDSAAIRNLKTGEIRGRLSARPVYPSMSNETLYGATLLKENVSNRRFVSMEYLNLEEQWASRPEEGIRTGWPVVVGDVLVLHTGRDRANIVGADRNTGERLWVTNTTEAFGRGSPLGSMFRVATDDTVYAIHEGGAVTAVDPTDGTILWQLKNEEMGWNPIRGCALADDLLVTVGGGNGKLFAIS